MKANLYSLNAKMMHIADHPSDPWLDENLRKNGIEPFKFGEFKGLINGSQGDVVVLSTSVPSAKTGDEFGVSQNLLDYLATKVSA